METVFITRESRIPQSCVDELKRMGVIVYEKRGTPEEISERVAGAEIVAAFYNDDLEKVIYDAPKLKFFINTAVGCERINFERMHRKGVTVINCPTYNSQAVAEHAVGLMFAAARKITEANQSLRRGEWLDEEFVGAEIADNNVGLIGHGNIGRRVEHILLGLTDKIRFVDSKSTAEAVDDLVEWADVVFICASLNDKSRHMLDGRRLAMLKPGAMIVNVSRGAIIDEQSLYDRLNKGDIAAGLDVFEHEPSGDKVEGIISQLVNLPNVVATPHIAYNTKESGEKLGREIIENIQACLSGKPINIVN